MRRTREVIERRNARVEELRRRRCQLNISNKQIALALNTTPSNIRILESLDSQFGDQFIQRYDDFLREWVGKIRHLAEGWGY